ncbi:MAG: hypothetical protein K1000chlam1_01167, partial [Candidatus Anoxychlamydiales bacterium]|nr:hypothetical protein [Candidatus Anoxychlamydiales bacterium]
MLRLIKSKYVIILITLINFSLFAENFNFSTPLDISSAAAFTPQITTDSSGRYVFAIWDNAPNIQTARSSDFSQT